MADEVDSAPAKVILRTCTDVTLLVIAVLCDIELDVNLAYSYWKTNNLLYFYLTLALVVSPTIVTILSYLFRVDWCSLKDFWCSLKDFCKKKCSSLCTSGNSKKFWCGVQIMTLVLLHGPVFHAIRSLCYDYSINSCKYELEKEPESNDDMKKKTDEEKAKEQNKRKILEKEIKKKISMKTKTDAEICRQELTEAFFQSAPQLCLQLYIMVSNAQILLPQRENAYIIGIPKDNFDNQLPEINFESDQENDLNLDLLVTDQALSIITSLAFIAKAITDNEQNKRSEKKEQMRSEENEQNKRSEENEQHMRSEKNEQNMRSEKNEQNMRSEKNEENERSNKKLLEDLSLLNVVAQYFWFFFCIGARILAVTLFASVYAMPCSALAVFRSIIMTLGLLVARHYEKPKSNTTQEGEQKPDTTQEGEQKPNATLDGEQNPNTTQEGEQKPNTTQEGIHNVNSANNGEVIVVCDLECYCPNNYTEILNTQRKTSSSASNNSTCKTNNISNGVSCVYSCPYDKELFWLYIRAVMHLFAPVIRIYPDQYEHYFLYYYAYDIIENSIFVALWCWNVDIKATWFFLLVIEAFYSSYVLGLFCMGVYFAYTCPKVDTCCCNGFIELFKIVCNCSSSVRNVSQG